MAKSIWTMNVIMVNILSQNQRALTALLVSVFPPDVEPAAGIFSHSVTGASWGPTLMLVDEVWIIFGVQVRPKSVGWGLGQGFV